MKPHDDSLARHAVLQSHFLRCYIKRLHTLAFTSDSLVVQEAELLAASADHQPAGCVAVYAIVKRF